MDRLEVYPPRVKDTLAYLERMFGGKTGSEKIYAFTPHQLKGSGNWTTGVAVLGEPGYQIGPVTERFTEYSGVEEFIGQLHGALGYDDATVLAIIGDTMARSRRQSDQRNGVVDLTMNLEQIELAISAVTYLTDNFPVDECGLPELLESAKDELTGDTYKTITASV